MAKVRPTLPRPATRSAYIPEALQSATHVFVRRDSHRYPLDAPYDGPFPVVTRKEKTIQIQIQMYWSRIHNNRGFSPDTCHKIKHRTFAIVCRAGGHITWASGRH